MQTHITFDTLENRSIQSTLALRIPRYYGQNPALHPAKAIEPGLTENDSRYCGLSLRAEGVRYNES